MNNYITKYINDYSKGELERLANNNQVIDVRTRDEYLLGHINHAILHPLDKIDTFNLDKGKTYYVHCQSGKRSQKASEALTKKGYDIVNLAGGFQAFTASYAQDDVDETLETNKMELQTDRKKLNYSGLQCPGPIVNLSQEINMLQDGKQLDVTVTDPGFASDVKSWAKQTGHTLVQLEELEQSIHAVVQKEKKKDIEVTESNNGTTIVLFSGELDKALAALIIANGARAAGKEVTIFFTFWGLNALKKETPAKVRKTGIAKLFGFMLPKSPVKMPLSNMNMFGLGNKMMRYIMKKKNVDSLPTLINQAIQQDIKLIACTMSMDVMGITKEELREEVQYGGVGTYIGETENAQHNLFI